MLRQHVFHIPFLLFRLPHFQPISRTLINESTSADSSVDFSPDFVQFPLSLNATEALSFFPHNDTNSFPVNQTDAQLLFPNADEVDADVFSFSIHPTSSSSSSPSSSPSPTKVAPEEVGIVSEPRPFSISSAYVFGYSYLATSLMFYAVPLIALLVFNWRIIRQLRQQFR